MLEDVQSLWLVVFQMQDKGTEVQSIRELRDIAKSDCLEAQLALCKAYVNGVLGAYTWPQAAGFIRDWVQRSRVTNTMHIYSNKELTHSMRWGSSSQTYTLLLPQL